MEPSDYDFEQFIEDLCTLRWADDNADLMAAAHAAVNRTAPPPEVWIPRVAAASASLND